MTRPEIIVSVDVEADGPIPGPNSLLSIGLAAYAPDGREVGTFYRNLLPLEGARPDWDTMQFWEEHKEAYATTQVDQTHPAIAFMQMQLWVESLGFPHGAVPNGKPTLAGYPILYDGMWVHWYCHKHLGASPFSHSGIDIKTVAMLVTEKTYRETSKRDLAYHLPAGIEHTHCALDDAREQGLLLMSMLRHLRGYQETL